MASFEWHMNPIGIRFILVSVFTCSDQLRTSDSCFIDKIDSVVS